MHTDQPRQRWLWSPTNHWALLMLVWVVLVSVTPPVANGQRYTFASYGLESGLTNVNVTTLLESSSGVIWVATQKGTFTANGSRFEEQTAFAEAGMEGAWAMAEDNEGRIWTVDGRHLVYWQNGLVHTVAGIKLHLLSVGGVALVRLTGQPEAIYLLHDSELQRIASADHGKTWQISAAFPPALLRKDPELKQLSIVVPGKGSTVWAGCGQAICTVDLAEGSLKKFGLHEGVVADSKTNFLLTRSGEVWVRGEHSVERMLKGENRFSPVAGLPKEPFLTSVLSSIVEDPDGRVILDIDEGVVRTDGAHWEILNHRNGLPQDEIDNMIFDHTGGLWLSPSGRGLARWLGYGNWEGWIKEDQLSSNIVLDIASDEAGRKWVATQVGLDSIASDNRHISHVNQPLIHQLSAVASHEGHIWTGDTLGSVVDFEPATGRTRTVLQHLNTVYQILADMEGRIWICSPMGLDFFTPADKWSVSHHIDPPLIPKGNAYGMSEGVAGTIWVMTETGMSRFDGSAWTEVKLPVDPGRPYNLMAAAAADGTLWVQSRHPTKIVHLQIQGATATVLSEYSDPVMQSENLGTMGVDKRGWLWIESDRGLQVFNGSRWVRCNSEDGLLYDNPDYPALLFDSDGSIWVGTSAGLSHLLHPERLFDVPKPTVELTELQLGETKLHEGVQEEFDLRRPPLSVSLLSTNYSRGSAMIYRYHLDGLESAGHETEDSRLRFAALDPGTYTLRVSAYDRRLHESSDERAVTFTVLEPWWNRTWFQLLEFVLCALIMFGLWRLSVRLLVMRQRELEGMVASRTGELEREKADLVNARSALIEMTRRDNLTGLLNRAAIFECMNALCEISLATGSPLAIVMADIDHFKSINDEYGHVVGDMAIRECADRIARTIRPNDFVGRYGGEELLILMPGLDPAISNDRLEALRNAIASEPIQRGSVELKITCSFGVAWMGHQRCALESLVNVADEALYLAKKNGRNRVEFAASERAAMN